MLKTCPISRSLTASGPFELPSSAELGRQFARRADRDREELPRVREQLERDRTARAAIAEEGAR